MSSEGKVANSGHSIVNLFAKKFGFVYTNINLSASIMQYDFYESMFSLVLSNHGAQEVINNLKTNSSPYPDVIHPLLVKKFS